MDPPSFTEDGDTKRFPFANQQAFPTHHQTAGTRGSGLLRRQISSLGADSGQTGTAAMIENGGVFPHAKWPEKLE